MKGEKIQKLKSVLKQFNEYIHLNKLNQYLEYSVITFDGLQPCILKDYQDNLINIDDIIEGGIALFGKSILLGLEELEKRINFLQNKGIECYKPWFVLLSNGQSYDELDYPTSKLKEAYQAGKLTYFPFELSICHSDERFFELQKLKKPIIISNTKYDCMFQWLLDTIEKRVSTPITKSIKLNSNCFDGWTIK